MYGRNDGPIGGSTGWTIGPILSEGLGISSIDVGIPQLSMHSVRAVTGCRDPDLGVQFFEGFLKERKV